MMLRRSPGTDTDATKHVQERLNKSRTVTMTTHWTRKQVLTALLVGIATFLSAQLLLLWKLGMLNPGSILPCHVYRPDIDVTIWNRDVIAFNKYLTNQRRAIMRDFPANGSYEVRRDITYASEDNRDYFQAVASHPGIRTFALRVGNKFDLENTSITWYKPPEGAFVVRPPRDSYVPVTDNETCAHHTSPPTTRYIHGYTFYNQDVLRTCEGRSTPAHSVQRIIPRGNNGDGSVFWEEYRGFLSRWERIYLHAVPWCLVSSIAGRTAAAGTVLVTETCLPQRAFRDHEGLTAPGFPLSGGITTHREVFVCNHHPHFFHWTAEGLSRLALYLPFLLENPDLPVLVPAQDRADRLAWLAPLGITRERVVSGHVRAGVAYIPQGARCRPSISALGLAILSDTYHTYIRDNLYPGDVIIRDSDVIKGGNDVIKEDNAVHEIKTDVINKLVNEGNVHDVTSEDAENLDIKFSQIKDKLQGDDVIDSKDDLIMKYHPESKGYYVTTPRDTVILIKRKSKRWLVQHGSIHSMLHEYCQQFGYALVIFDEADLPELHVTMRMFYRAVMIVAPHGAGLINLIFSRPPVVVIEVICNNNSSTLSFLSISRILGHVYYAIRSSGQKIKRHAIYCNQLVIDLEEFSDIIQFYMKWIQGNASKLDKGKL